MPAWGGDSSFVDGFKADDTGALEIVGSIVRSLINFLECALKHLLLDIHLFFHALGLWGVREEVGGEGLGWRSTAAEFW